MRGWAYDRLVAGMTTRWYREVLRRVPEHARMLDVGIGTGAALANCAELVQSKDLQVTGLDIDPDYLQRCQRNLAGAGLAERVAPRLESVYDHSDGPYDVIYFSASLMLLPDPTAAIAMTAALLTPGGRIYATQTFQNRRSKVVEWAKPLMRHITTIEFGRITYEDDFRRSFAAAGMELEEMYPMRTTRHTSYRLAVGRPASLRKERIDHGRQLDRLRQES